MARGVRGQQRRSYPADGTVVKCPVSNEDVTVGSAPYVQYVNGQRVYFSSAKSAVAFGNSETVIESYGAEPWDGSEDIPANPTPIDGKAMLNLS